MSVKYFGVEYICGDNESYRQALSLYRFIKNSPDLVKRLVNINLDPENSSDQDYESNEEDKETENEKAIFFSKEKCLDKKIIGNGEVEVKSFFTRIFF